MGFIRTFEHEDVAPVADLFQRVRQGENKPASPALQSYFTETLFSNPWYDEALPSLVYQNSEGKIIGFLGVIPRRMSLNGRSIQVAVGNHFIVHPEYRSTFAGVQLLKQFFCGPQDLSMTDEANDFARRIWEGCGGMTSILYSIHWRRPLRPTRYATSLLRKSSLPVIFDFMSRPICHILDAILVRISQSPFLQLTSELSGEGLDEVQLLDCLSKFSSSQPLLPEYDIQSLKWLLARLSQKKMYGTLRKILVRNSQQEIVGWYIYYLNPGSNSEVIQIGAMLNSIKDVLNHLFYDAWRHGALALHGRLEPKFIQDFSDECCIFDRRGSWMLVHSNKPEILQPILSGDAFLTRLEGEWWLRSQEV